MSIIKQYKVRKYQSNPLTIFVGERYKAEGMSGLTDGVEVTGKLIEIELDLDYALIFSDELQLPCAVILNSIYELEPELHIQKKGIEV